MRTAIFTITTNRKQALFVCKLPQSLFELNGNSVGAQLPDLLVVSKRKK